MNGRGTLGSYLTGYLLSLYATVTAYILVVRHAFGVTALLAAIIGLALLQFLVQLFYFLHLGKETGPRWRLLAAAFMIVVVAILVFGSLWIMANLNYRMTPEQVNTYIQNQGGF